MSRILVIGAGAVGGYISARLWRAGTDVHLLARTNEQARAIDREGLAITERLSAEAWRASVPVAVSSGFQPPSGFDFVLIATKGALDKPLIDLVQRSLSVDGYVASLQNGLPDTELAQSFGAERVLGVVVARLGVEREGVSHIVRGVPRGQEHPATLLVAPFDDASNEQRAAAAKLAALLQDVDRTEVRCDLLDARWTKLCVNAMRNALAAASGLSANEMDRFALLRHYGLRLGSEAVQVARAVGANVHHVFGLDADLLARFATDPLALKQLDEQLSLGASDGSRDDRQRPSMAQDLARNAATEIRHINGVIVHEGERLGISVTANRYITELIHQIERGETHASPDHFIQL